MTITPRRLQSLALWSQPRAIRKTAQASHAAEMADAASDAASGHPGQRVTLGRPLAGVYHAFIHPLSPGRFYEVTAVIAWRGAWTLPDGAQIALSITDGTTTRTPPNAEIPTVFHGALVATHWPGIAASGARINATANVVGYLDREALVTAGLSATVPWRLTFTLVCGGTVYIESLEVTECSRFATDSTETFGVDPRVYQPRATITDVLSRVGATIEAGYDLNRRTYHALSLPEATPDIVTSAAYAAIPGAQTLTGSTAIGWIVRPRRIRGTPALLWGVRYLTTTAAGGDVRITTGSATFTLALPGTTGVWTDYLLGTGALLNATTDTIAWEARVSAGQLKIAAYLVLDDPAP